MNPHYGLRTDRHTLAFFPRHNEWELYDLDKDPQQLRNIAGDAAQVVTVASLKEELVRLREHFGDTNEVVEPAPRRPVNQQQGK